MELLLEPISQDAENCKSEWDKHVPIIKCGKEVDIYISSEIVTPIEYNEVCYVIKELSSKYVCRIHLNTPGGRLDSAKMIIRAIRESEAYIIAVLEGDVASAGTMIALACDEIQAEFEVEFLIHNFSGGSGGKGGEIKTQNAFTEKHMPELYKRIYKDFLTDEEIAKVIDDKDIILNGEEVVARFNGKFAKEFE